MKNPELRVERVEGDLQAIDLSSLLQIAAVYADAFKWDEWNEWTKCPVDGKFFGATTSPGEPSACCNEPLQLAYPAAETVEYIQCELTRPGASLFVLKDDVQIAGFSWAFKYASPGVLAREKYRTDQMRERVVGALAGMGITGSLYYLSETGILKDARYRGRGISNDFYRLRLERAQALGLPAVQRTTINSPMYMTARSAGMTQVIGPIAERRGSGCTVTGKFAGGIEDSELSPRVLFATTFGD